MSSDASLSTWNRESLEQRFRTKGIAVVEMDQREFPDETIFVAFVEPDDFDAAISAGIEITQRMDQDDFPGFLTVRVRRSAESKVRPSGRVKGVHDPRANDLVELLTSRSRTSDALPSLHYILDSSTNLAAAIAPRHHLVLGRRGVGKTALLLEAKSRVVDAGQIASWTNLQVLRREPTPRMLLYMLDSLFEAVLQTASGVPRSSRTMAAVVRVYEDIAALLNLDEVTSDRVDRLIPQVQKSLKRFTSATGQRIFVFLDDFYFVPRKDQPAVLDALHACLRDCDAWLKIASIQSLTRWFIPSPPVGLQTGQDVDVINLDVTLQEPAKAKSFLESILKQYTEESGIGRASAVLRGAALDRLVLACGGVPRDYLVLAGAAILKAQKRPSGQLAGVQDVNEAAGDAAQSKIIELEEDLSTEAGEAQLTLRALEVLRSFCLDMAESTYYRVDFRDRDSHPDEYALLIALSELRLNHMINSSLSDAHHAGEKSEVFMLDLSQFSGSRLKQGVEVLDLVDGTMLSKRTGTAGSDRHGGTPRQLNTILRSAPAFALRQLTSLGN